MNAHQDQADFQDNLYDIKRILLKVLSKWYLLVITVGICMALAYLLDKYTKPVYGLSTLLYIKPDNDKANVSSILYGEETFGTSRNLSNQMIFLKSRLLIEKTLNDLDFDVSYFIKGKFITAELYKDSPIEVIVDSTSTYIPYYTDFSCSILTAGKFVLSVDEKENLPAFTNKTLKFDEWNEIDGFKFKVSLRYPVLQPGEALIFRVNSIEGLTDYYINSIYVSQFERDASVLKISYEEETPDKGKDFLNQLVYNFIENNLQEKNEIASRTVNFINQMLNQNKDSLATIESKIERFKGNNTVISVQEKGTLLVSELKQLEKEKAELLTVNQYFDLLENSLQKGDEQLVIPSALGIEDASLTAIINELISLRLENKMLKADNKLKNPFIEVNNQKIEELKNTLKEKIKTQKAINTINLANINQRINTSYASQQRLPAAEREFKDISRNYAISETLVQFLMEKRAEAGIARASNISDYKMIDAARVESGPIKRKQFDYKMALLAGLAIPIVCIVLLDYINNKISSKEELVKLSQVPLLGVIVHGDKANTLFDKKSLKSAFVESLRSVRSNLNYLSEHTDVSKIILVTSSVSGEGKSFCSTNISYILALSGKRTLLIKADMRKVEAAEKELGVKAGLGLSEYLSAMASLNDVIQPTYFENLFLINSGNIPPNPSELLLGDRMKQLLADVKAAFDVIILDTPPIGIVSDGLELMKQSDINLIVVRERYTEKPFLKYINDLYVNHKYKHMAYVYNDANLNKTAYGYGVSKYGYGYYADQKVNRSFLGKIIKARS
jgi:capsular exopolysaccharide synthesis family protein